MRLPLCEPDELSPDILAHYELTKLDVTRLQAHAKTIYPHWRHVTRATFSDLAIPAAERELMVLAVLHLEQGAYPWAQHAQVAAEVGISQEKISAISAEQFTADIFSEREKALLAFARQVVRNVRVDDATFAAVAAFYDPRQIVESIYTIGIYMLMARLTEVCELPIDNVHGGAIVSAAVEQRAASPT